ncbi:septum formation initiator family protein [Litorimonas sp. RW-G-Af-16]|uniref:septum formation initiator family protein n=1 Tax=Litorimonas sp. RW-G-Af-16 TaxID=3241168 RepID=UPI00390C7933
MKRLAQIRQKFPVIALLALYAYLAFHAFSGSQGIMRWMTYSDQSRVLNVKLDALEAHRAALQSDVDALSPNHLNLDLLDEKARETLHVSDPKEMTIWLDQSP